MRTLELSCFTPRPNTIRWRTAEEVSGRLAGRVVRQLQQEFPEDLRRGFGFDTGYLHRRLRDLAYVAPRIEHSSMRLLELGCGSNSVHGYPPWLCRALVALGHSVTGVDLFGPHPRDAYEWIEADLGDANALDACKQGSYDAAFSFACLDSDALHANASRMSVSDLRTRLVETMPLVLKPNGVFVYEYVDWSAHPMR